MDYLRCETGTEEKEATLEWEGTAVNYTVHNPSIILSISTVARVTGKRSIDLNHLDLSL